MARFRKYKHNHRFNKQRFRPRYTLFQRMSYFSRKHPIAIGVLLLIASIVLCRLAYLFYNGSELFGWMILFSVLLFIASILVLKGYWRNNVVNFNAKHQVNWRTR